MGSGSTRLRANYSPHQHDDPPPDGVDAGAPAPCAETPDEGEEAVLAMMGTLRRREGKLLYTRPDSGEAVEVRLLWARPLSGRGGPFSIMEAKKKREVAYAPSLESLPPDSRRIAEEELAASMVLPKIVEIRNIWPRFGNYYWEVETDMGSRTFLLASPENNTFRPKRDTLLIKDVSGNCYEIPSVSALDPASLHELDKAL